MWAFADEHPRQKAGSAFWGQAVLLLMAGMYNLATITNKHIQNYRAVISASPMKLRQVLTDFIQQ